MRTTKSNCPLVRSQKRSATASREASQAVAKLVLAFVLGLVSFGGGISVAMSLNGNEHSPSHYVASLAPDSAPTDGNSTSN